MSNTPDPTPRRDAVVIGHKLDIASLNAIRRGVSKLSDALKMALGPAGRNALLQKSFGDPTAIRDGVTVAQEIELDDVREDVGARMIRQVASRTKAEVRDGTRTAAVMAEAIFNEGLRAMNAGADAVTMTKGIERAVAEISTELQSMAVQVTDKKYLAAIGSLATNNDAQLSQILADAMEKVGADGMFVVEEGKSPHTDLNWQYGIRLDSGYLSPYFVTDSAKMQCVLEDAYVLVVEITVKSYVRLLQVLEAVLRTDKPILVIADDIESESIEALVAHKLLGNLKVAAVKAPGYGDHRKAMMQDVANLTGGTKVSDSEPVPVPLSYFGRAKKVIIDSRNTIITGGAGKSPDIDARIRDLWRSFESTSSTQDREKIYGRLVKMSRGVVVVNAGGGTDIEAKRKKAAIEDALEAMRLSMEEGVVPGGGAGLLHAAARIRPSQMTHDEELGYNIVREACRLPLKTIAENSGEDGAVVCEKVAGQEQYTGFNALTHKYENLMQAGVIDPVKVTRTALSNAASIAGSLLTSESVMGQVRTARQGNFGIASEQSDSAPEVEPESPEPLAMRPVFWIQDQGPEETLLSLGEEYLLKIKMSNQDLHSLVRPDEGIFASKELPASGLATQWLVFSRSIRMLKTENVIVEECEEHEQPTWYATFDLRIPHTGESETRQLKIIPMDRQAVISVLIFAVYHLSSQQQIRRELIRHFEVQLPVEAEKRVEHQ